MKKSKISIVTICYNAEDKIAKTINSVLFQTYDNYEYIIVDGKSNDKTIKIITDVIDSSDLISKEKVKLISEKDNGITDAFNKGIKNANGEFLLFLNAGDFLVSNGIMEKCVKYLKNSCEIYSGHIIKLPSQRVIKSKIRNFGFENETLHPATFIGYQVFEKIGVYDTNFKIAMDFEYWARAKHYKIKFNLIDYPISYFEEGGVSSIEIDNVLKETHLVRRKYKNGNILIQFIYLSKVNYLTLKFKILLRKQVLKYISPISKSNSFEKGL